MEKLKKIVINVLRDKILHNEIRTTLKERGKLLKIKYMNINDKLNKRKHRGNFPKIRAIRQKQNQTKEIRKSECTEVFVLLLLLNRIDVLKILHGDFWIPVSHVRS